jgi:TRAP-type C4-dicarboxylate transport system permease small subunit
VAEGKKGVLDKLEKAMTAVAALCLFTMALVTGADVVGRGALNAPLFGSEEIVSILAVLAVGLSLPYAHSQDSHIGVEALYQRLPRSTRRFLRFSTGLAAAALFGVTAWRMVLYGFSMRASGMVSMNLALPVYWVVWVLGGCFVVFAVRLAQTALQSLSKDFR